MSTEANSIDMKGPVRTFVLEYAQARGISEVKDDDSLLKNNVIDSLGVFRMIAFLEETFPLTVEDTDMVPENFQTINDIEKFVSNKLGIKPEGVSQCAQSPLQVAS